MSRDPKSVIAAIDASLQQAVDDGRTCLSVHLHWIYYRELLAMKGIEWEMRDQGHDAQHRDRPLKKYKFWPLYLQPQNNPQSWVQWPAAHGGVAGLVIKFD